MLSGMLSAQEGRHKHPEPKEEVAVAVRRADLGRGADREPVLALLAEYLASLPAGDNAARRFGWLYRDNPHGRAETFLACERGSGALIGMTSLFPRRVQVGGRVLLGAIGGDGYVRPAYRRRGIATLLHRAALAGMEEGPVEFMYGPPEPHNLRALLHAGSAQVGWATRYRRAFGPAGLGHFSRRLPAVLGPAAAWLLRPPRSALRLAPLGDRPDARVDRIFRAAVDEGAQVLPVRDAAYYAWRFGRSPSGRQQPVLLCDGAQPLAAAVIERKDGHAALIDVLCPRRARRRVLRGLLHACQDREAVQIQVHTPSLGWQAALFGLGFLPRQRKPFQVQLRPGHPDRALLLRPAAWDYQWGDGDIDHVL